MAKWVKLVNLSLFIIYRSDEMYALLCWNTRNKCLEAHLENLICQMTFGKSIRLIYLQNAIWIKWRAVNVHIMTYHPHYDLERYLRVVSNYTTILWHYYFFAKRYFAFVHMLSWLIRKSSQGRLRTRMQS